jgi:hypothetical protein
MSDGSYITIDCVVRKFDYEEPYSEKKDTNMDLEYLNGVAVSDRSNNKNIDALALSNEIDGQEDMTELNKILNSGSGMGDLGKKGKLKALLKKGLHISNIANPATATIRAGILLSAKLNILKIGERLKWAYLSDEDAKKKGIDMNRFAKLKKVKNKLEDIFYGMGGKPENLKKAVLKGHGNRNHDVSGLGYVPDDMNGIDETSSAEAILGTEMYQDELSGVDTGNDGLGIVAATAIASATGVMGLIAGILKTVGGIFPKKSEGGGDGNTDTGNGGGGDAASAPTVDVSANGNTASDTSTTTSNANGAANRVAQKITNQSPATTNTTTTPTTTNDDGSTDDGSTANNGNNARTKNSTDTPSTNTKDTSTKPDSKSKLFWQNNKKWIKPTAIGVGGLVALFTGLHFYHKHKEEEPPPKKPSTAEPGVAGIAKKYKRKKGGSRAKRKNNRKKTAIALL